MPHQANSGSFKKGHIPWIKGKKGIHCSPSTEFKKGQISRAKGIKRLDLVERNKSPQHRAMVSKALEGRTMPPEFGQKISASKKGKHINHSGPSLETGHKISLANKGKHSSPETEFKKGREGRRISPELREKMNRGIRESYAKGRVPWNKGIKWPQPWWNDPEWKAQQIQKYLTASFIRPTGPERKLIRIIKKYKLPYKYTGDGSFIIGGLNPDFVNINGEKIAIDVFGDYWHTLKADRETYTEEGRKKFFNK